MTQDEIRRMLAHETPLRGLEAARKCGVRGGTLVRWIRKGRLMPDGRRRLLEGYQAGRGWMTSVEALARFLAGPPRMRESAPVAKPSLGFDRKRYEEVKRQMLAKGKK